MGRTMSAACREVTAPVSGSTEVSSRSRPISAPGITGVACAKASSPHLYARGWPRRRSSSTTPTAASAGGRWRCSSAWIATRAASAAARDRRGGPAARRRAVEARDASWHLVMDPPGAERSARHRARSLQRRRRLRPGAAAAAPRPRPAPLVARVPGPTERGYRWVVEHRGPLGRFVPARAALGGPGDRGARRAAPSVGRLADGVGPGPGNHLPSLPPGCLGTRFSSRV